MSVAPFSLRNYALVTLAYWAFTLTDGALRMLVLLHFHQLGYEPFHLALLFVLYEALGAGTNLFGGMLATRTGLKATLVGGLALQVVALVLLSGLNEAWASPWQVVWIVGAQGLSGVAKDLTKLSAKSAIKMVGPADGGALFRWVARLTGSKNALKGGGFFLGAALLDIVGFEGSLRGMAGALFVVAGICGVMLPEGLGRAPVRSKLSRLIATSHAVNLLSGARVFLFGARDVWFVVALPVFITDRLMWSFTEVGAYMAAWVIGYGVVQVGAPRVLAYDGMSNSAGTALLWSATLAVSPFLIALGLSLSLPPGPVVLGGLAVFGVLFAVNSSLHSYLILAYARPQAVTADVGFYYMSNAWGRLLGTVLSGLVYQLAGLNACLLTAGVMLVVASVLSWRLPDPGGAILPRTDVSESPTGRDRIPESEGGRGDASAAP